MAKGRYQILKQRVEELVPKVSLEPIKGVQYYCEVNSDESEREDRNLPVVWHFSVRVALYVQNFTERAKQPDSQGKEEELDELVLVEFGAGVDLENVDVVDLELPEDSDVQSSPNQYHYEDEDTPVYR